MNKYDRQDDILMGATQISPSMAKDMLARNTDNNRNVSLRRVQAYAEEMRWGRFALNGETIKFDRSGRLIDGQHRLMACVKSETPFSAFVVRDLDPLVFSTIDTGKARRASDELHRNGAVNSVAAASAIRWVLRMKSGKVFSNTDYTSAFIFEFWSKNRQIDNSVAVAGRKMTRRLTSPAMSTALHFLFASKDAVEANSAFDVLETGTSPIKDDPFLLLREKLIREISTATRKKTGKQASEMAAWMINCWNARRARQPLKILKGPYLGGDGNPRLPDIN